MSIHPRRVLYSCGALFVLWLRHVDAAPPADAIVPSSKLFQPNPPSPTPPSVSNEVNNRTSGTTVKASFPFPPLWNVWPPSLDQSRNAKAERNASGVSGVDIMPLFVRPFASIFDSLQWQKNAQQKSMGKVLEKTDDATQPKIDAKVAENFLNYIFDISTTTTTQAPPPSVMLMRTFFEPIVNSIRRDLRKKAEATETYSALPAPVEPPRPRANGIPTTLFNVDASLHKSGDVDDEGNAGSFVRRSPASRVHRTMPTTQAHEASQERGSSPIASLLQFIGMDSRAKKEEVQIGRDRSVSVLGMPVGQRDGLALSPLKGVSLGNQEMFGPIAVNDRYNVKWDFLDNFGENFPLF